MTIFVQFCYDPSHPTDEESTAISNWLAPYLAAGNTTKFPADIIGGDPPVYIRDWDTEENANAFITMLTALSFCKYARIVP